MTCESRLAVKEMDMEVAMALLKLKPEIRVRSWKVCGNTISISKLITTKRQAFGTVEVDQFV